ncbi:M23 family metallopeptidase [Spirillospora sp. CA-294931]|uniref:M23 family metallopeptidase n=1 Tax=Spirillospora sp. CA-294931 TaxID=3240042 RepID=UPI003D8B7593
MTRTSPETRPPDEDATPVRGRRGPGPFTLLALPALTVLVGFTVLLAVTGVPDEPGPRAADAEAASGTPVDPSYVPWLRAATRACTVVRPSVLAAQIDEHSGWNTDSAALGESGIAGFTPAEWRTWGRDEDGNGRSSPLDPVDAIMALGRRDCALARRMADLRARGTITGDLLDLTLAAAMAGPRAVRSARGVPPKARAHVTRIATLAKRYTKFDEKEPTRPLAGAVLTPPLTPLAITSPFGARKHPLLGISKLHTGLDLAAPEGAPVTPARAGTVIFAGTAKGYGNRVVIDHGTLGGKPLQTTYNHLSALLTTTGRPATPTTPIGRVGSTGLSTGPHLHFEVIYDGYYTDPAPWLPPNR